MSEFLEINGLLNRNQAGFRANFSTIDHIFSLHLLIEKFLAKGKKLYCAFIDYAKAFDTVWRGGLWFKLVNHGITGKCLTVIMNMYNGIKSMVEKENILSDVFPCNMGVRQGENLSPLLFALFLNDMERSFENLGSSGVDLNKEFETKQFFSKLLLLLYADDTVILADSKEDLQKSLDNLAIYSKTWKLEVNTEKTKVMIFSRSGKNNKNLTFKFGGEPIEIVNEFKYLGIVFRNNGRFINAIKFIKTQANKALRCLIARSRYLELSVEIQLKLFDSLVAPILTYGAEVWGFESTKMLDQLELKFYKLLLNVRNSTPNYMVYGELGRYPISISIKKRMISYWCNLLISNQSKINKDLYAALLDRPETCKWLMFLKTIFDSIGKSDVWLNQGYQSKIHLCETSERCLKDQFLQNWNSEMLKSSKGRTYSSYKTSFEIEDYLRKLPKKHREILCQFRCANHKLPVETGRWIKLDYHLRKCDMCDTAEVGDEFHVLLKCSALKDLQKTYIPNYFTKYPSLYKFQSLLNGRNPSLYKKVSIFISKLSSFRKSMIKNNLL